MAEIVIPVNVSMVSFLVIDVAEEYNRIKITERRSHAVLKKNCVAFLRLWKEGVIWDFEQRMR